MAANSVVAGSLEAVGQVQDLSVELLEGATKLVLHLSVAKVLSVFAAEVTKPVEGLLVAAMEEQTTTLGLVLLVVVVILEGL